MTPSRAILHVDMDAFYASVEQRDDPKLRGVPLVVGGASRRGVVAAASYEARKFGIRSAMPMVRALHLCPHLTVVPPRGEVYEEVSGQVFAIFEAFTPLVEGLSLDEAFLDVTGSITLFGPPAEQARRIQGRIRDELRLSCSVGISDVKFAAKIASDLRKPGGLVEVPPGGVREFLAPMPVSRLWGVGPRTEEQLLRMGLRTVGDVAAADRGWLERTLGSLGPWLHDLANGIDDRAVEPDVEAKSIGAEETFDDDLRGAEALSPFLHEQALRVAARLRRARSFAGNVTVKIKYSDFQLVSRQATLPRRTDDGEALYHAACALLSKVDLNRPVRLTGLSAGELSHDEGQLGLFDAQAKKRALLNRSLDRIAERFGEDAVVPADLVKRRRG